MNKLIKLTGKHNCFICNKLSKCYKRIKPIKGTIKDMTFCKKCFDDSTKNKMIHLRDSDKYLIPFPTKKKYNSHINTTLGEVIFFILILLFILIGMWFFLSHIDNIYEMERNINDSDIILKDCKLVQTNIELDDKVCKTSNGDVWKKVSYKW